MIYQMSCDYCGHGITTETASELATIADEWDLHCVNCETPICLDCVKWRVEGDSEVGICNSCVDPENTTIPRAIDISGR